MANYLSTELAKLSSDGKSVTVGNVALVDNAAGAGNAGAGLGETTVLTVVRTSQDLSRRTPLNSRRVDLNNPAQGLIESRPPLHVDLDVLVTANYKNYGDALDVLSRLMAVLQLNATLPLPGTNERLTASLVPLSYEQQNHLWSMLGGKQRPAVLYRLQTIDIAYRPDSISRGPQILETLLEKHPDTTVEPTIIPTP